MSDQQIPYRYCFNSANINVHKQGSQMLEHPAHIPSMDGYREGDKLTVAYQGTIGTSDEDALHALYQIFNAPFERPDEYAGPSMSIGDVVSFYPGEANEISFAVAQEGFTKVDITRSTVERAPERWTRTGETLKKYRIIKNAEIGETYGE